MSSILGAIIAGGGATRFGSDKGAAQLGDTALIDHISLALRPQVDALVVVGRAWRDLPTIEDRPAPGLGPLGGLCAALLHGKATGHQMVLAVGCDTLPLPANLAAALAPGPCVVEGQWLIGLWPVSLANRLEAFLLDQPDHSIRAWMCECCAKMRALPHDFVNINTPEDLATLSRRDPPPDRPRR